MKQLLKNAKTIITILILTLSLNGCDNNDDNLPEIFAGFTHTINNTTGTVTFINTSSDVRYYSWDFGDGTTSTEINPIKSFANGTYVVVLTIKNVAGATATYEDSITIGGISTTAPCDSETVESMLAASLNITFKTDQTANVIKDGTSFQWVANPKSDTGINTSCYVGKVTKTATNPWDNVQVNLDAKLDFATHTGIKIKVFSSVPGFKVLLKLEDKTNSATNTELSVTTTKTNEWEELSFPFASTHSSKYDKIVLIFDLATANTNTYYFDDITFYGTGSGVVVGGTCTTEAAESMAAASLNVTFKTDQTANIRNDNANFSWVTNPKSDTGINTSCKVGKVVKTSTNAWDNNQIDLSAKLDFTSHSGLKMKVFSAVPGFKVLVKLESIANPASSTEIEITSTKTSEWEELSFPFGSTHSGKFDRIVLIFDLATKNSNTYYFDDLTFYGSGSGSVGGGSSTAYALTKAIDFETTGYGANWTWNVFENVDNPELVFMANPVSGGINTSAKVAKIIARKAGQPWVGTETAHGQMGITWDLSASNAVIRIMVYKTVISDVGIKLVNPAGGAQGEIKVANTKINQWEELTFDFSSRIGNGLDGSTNIDQIVIFPDFNTAGRATETVTYFDNITFGSK